MLLAAGFLVLVICHKVFIAICIIFLLLYLFILPVQLRFCMPHRYFAHVRRYIFVDKYDKCTLLSFFKFCYFNETLHEFHHPLQVVGWIACFWFLWHKKYRLYQTCSVGWIYLTVKLLGVVYNILLFFKKYIVKILIFLLDFDNKRAII